MKMIKREEIIPALFGVAFIVWGLYMMVVELDKDKSLFDNMEYSDATIINFSSGPRSKRYLDYKFRINNKEYQGSGRHYPASDTISVGDTILIVYDRENPENNRSARDF